ncbi:hypothetical protein TNCV_2045391 [Trichonephila clavipes]|uniref:DUF5641 domain-containing protein n=1 Tax=Trichonephila clavipes TaxID=2585209 RepID=A0A8X6SRC1_TRICX|nr:hypothetical protein TNCV_2045391 [Trichonephila clavipes]
MVLVKEDNLPPLQWSLGGVVQVFPGDDGAVRVVDVKTQRGQFRRPITKCCLLPTEDCELIVQAGIPEDIPSFDAMNVSFGGFSFRIRDFTFLIIACI